MKITKIGGFAGPFLCLGLLLFSGTWQVRGSETNTNDTRLTASSEQRPLAITQNPGPDSPFLERFFWEIGQNGPRNSLERFGPLSKFIWAQRMEHEGYGRPSAESQGERMFGDTLSDSFLDAFTSGVDFNRFKRSDKPILTFGAKFIEGSLSTVEPHLNDTAQPDEIGLMREFVRTLFNERTEYGINVLNANPYFFYARAFGRNRDELPIVIWKTRLRMMFLSSRFGVPRIDEDLYFPIDQRTQISAGYRFYPTRFDGTDWKPVFTLKFAHEIGKHIDENVIYASFQSEEREPVLIIVGFSIGSF